jgi:predicted ArsR family transcriptional regulator
VNDSHWGFFRSRHINPALARDKVHINLKATARPCLHYALSERGHDDVNRRYFDFVCQVVPSVARINDPQLMEL